MTALGKYSYHQTKPNVNKQISGKLESLPKPPQLNKQKQYFDLVLQKQVDYEWYYDRLLSYPLILSLRCTSTYTYKTKLEINIFDTCRLFYL